MAGRETGGGRPGARADALTSHPAPNFFGTLAGVLTFIVSSIVRFPRENLMKQATSMKNVFFTLSARVIPSWPTSSAMMSVPQTPPS